MKTVVFLAIVFLIGQVVSTDDISEYQQAGARSMPGRTTCRVGDSFYKWERNVYKKCTCMNHPLISFPVTICQTVGCTNDDGTRYYRPNARRQDGCRCVPGNDRRYADRSTLYRWSCPLIRI